MSSSLKIILILLLVLGISYDVYRWHEAPAGAPDAAAMAGGGDAAPVGVAVVIGKDVQLWNEFSGRLTAVDQSEVRPQVGGVIESVHFTDGAKVSKGDLLFTIDQRPYAADLDRAKGVLASATATATLARKEASRADRLVKDKAISEHDFDQRKSAADVADANQKSAQAAFETAQLNFDYTTIRAPIAGRAGRVEITAGNLVQASPNAPLLTTIVSDGTIYADFDMDEVSFLQYIHSASGNVNNIPVELGLAAETGTPHTGHIQSFDNRINTSSGTIRVRAVFDNADGALVPGMFARLLVGSAGESRRCSFPTAPWARTRTSSSSSSSATTARWNTASCAWALSLTGCASWRRG